MSADTYIDIMQRGGNVLRAGVRRGALNSICRFIWSCPTCVGRFEQFTKFLNAPHCPRCGHAFGERDYTKRADGPMSARLLPTIADRSEYAGKPLGKLLPMKRGEPC